MISNLCLLFWALAKFLALTGLGLGIAIVILFEACGFRVVGFGLEKVSRGEQLARKEKATPLIPSTVQHRQPARPREVKWRHA